MSDEFSLECLYANPNIHNELFQLIESHSCSQLDARLQQLSNANHYLPILRRYDGQQVSLLMSAASYGYDDIVRVLLARDNTPDHVEVKGRIILSNGISIDGATALYCACYNGYFTVAQTLIELGHANVNQDTNTYPLFPLLLHATIDNRRDIIDFLLDNNYADINQTKSSCREKSSALTLIAFRGPTSLVEYLISKGADVNCTCQDEDLICSKPIGLAVLGGQIDIVRLLYHAGADTKIKNTHGDVLVTAAVCRRFPVIIDFLLDEFINTIDDLELAACSLIEFDSPIEDMNYMITILKMTLKRREQSNMSKTCIGPIDVYDYQRECQTFDELDSIKDDQNRMYIETLLIRERIALSQNDISIVKPLHFYGDMLVANEQFEKCLNIWIHMFYLYQKMSMTTSLHRFVWLFCRMLTANQRIPAEWFLRVGRLVFEPSHVEEENYSALSTVLLIVIATKILKQKELSEDDRTWIYSWVQEICRYRFATKDGKNLLHLCVDVDMEQIFRFRLSDTSQHLKIPDESALRLLLTYRSRWLDLDAVESAHCSTPLHLVCQQSNIRPILELLLKSGCHTDSVDRYGKTPLDYIQDDEMRRLFPSEQSPSKLKCRCARLIAKERLNIRRLESSTLTLKKFVILHGYHSNE